MQVMQYEDLPKEAAIELLKSMAEENQELRDALARAEGRTEDPHPTSVAMAVMAQRLKHAEDSSFLEFMIKSGARVVTYTAINGEPLTYWLEIPHEGGAWRQPGFFNTPREAIRAFLQSK